MAISYVGGKVQGFGGTTSAVSITLTNLTGGSDTAPSAGDFVVVYYGTGSNTTARAITVNSDYTNLTKIAESDTYDANLVVGYKRMGSTPDTSVEVSATLNLADAGAVVVHVFRGVDETTPLDVTSVTATGTNSVLCNPGAITPSTAGAWIVAGGSGAHIAGTDTYSSSDLTSFRTVGANDTFDVTVGAGLKTDWTSGPFDPAAFTWSDTSASTYSWAAYTLALRPSPNELVIPTGVSSTGQVDGVRVPTSVGISYIGGTTLGFLGTSSTTDVSLTSLTGGVNSSPQEGDLVVVYYGVASVASEPLGISVGSSYTNLGETFQEDTYSVSMAVAYKFMGSTPDAAVTLSQTFNIAYAGAAVIHVFSGVDTTTPMDVTSTVADSPSTAIPNPPAITPVTAGAWIVAGGAGGHIDGTDTYASSDLSSFRTVGSNDTYDVSLGAGLYSEWTSGPFNPAAFTWTGANTDSYSSVARTIALRPLSFSTDVIVSVTGVSATPAVGTVTITGTSTTDTTGVSSSAAVGTVVASVSANIDAPVTGVTATAAVGTVTVTGTSTVNTAGVSAAAGVDTVTVTGTSTANTTGVGATAEVGTVTITGASTADLIGSSATAEVGAVVVSVGANIDAPVTGVSATAAVGTVAVAGTSTTNTTGVSATAGVGSAIVSLGDNVTADVSGVAATSSVGIVTVAGAAEVLVLGATVQGYVGQATVGGGGDVNFSPRLLYRMRRLQPWKRRYRV
jgi:hypothetical protein